MEALITPPPDKSMTSTRLLSPVGSYLTLTSTSRHIGHTDHHASETGAVERPPSQPTTCNRWVSAGVVSCDPGDDAQMQGSGRLGHGRLSQ